ncbi:endolytic transglycosylase MltG [Thermodesulfovibrionales bacterium]|nr:endolytic transglycosylase MltG [Thermodesulfovibrionales bacterium]
MKYYKNSIKLIAVSIFFLFLAYAGTQLLMPLNIGSTQVKVKIPEGATLRLALDILAENNLVRDKNLFVAIGVVTGMDRRIRAGYYAFWGNMSPLQVFDKLRKGNIIEHEVTIVEGACLWDIGERLEDSGIMSLDDFKALARDADFLSSLNIDAPSLEGFLFPETYRFPKGTEPRDVLELMVNTMRERFTGDLRNRAEEIGWSEREVLTLASIIEKEAAVAREKPLISGVFHNRLQKGMRLQADPTAIYGVRRFRYGVTRADWRRVTPFNTYIIHGLPPGPIASPGINSIIAAVYPADVPYIFFVSNRDGTHHFSTTYAEHNMAIMRSRR